MVIDGAFLGANLAKLGEGGWVPLSIGAVVFTLAMIWRWGRRTLAGRIAARTKPVEDFLAREDVRGARRVPGTTVFLTAATQGVPPILTHHFERSGVLAEQVVLLTVQTLDIPFVDPKQRIAPTDLGGGFHRVVARFGYTEMPNVPAVLEFCALHGLVVDFDRITYVLGRDALRLKHAHGPLSIHRRIFSFLSRNQATPLTFFHMPVDKVIEIGMQLEL
jgi:KUP system potassium uptake protein